MNDDFNEVLNKFSDILKEKNIDLNEFGINNSSKPNGEVQSSPLTENNDFNLDIETIMKIKNILTKLNENQNSPRNQLLKSLKPYLDINKKEKLDQYIKIANIISVLDNLELGSNFFKFNEKGYDSILIITLFLLIF